MSEQNKPEKSEQKGKPGKERQRPEQQAAKAPGDEQKAAAQEAREAKPADKSKAAAKEAEKPAKAEKSAEPKPPAEQGGRSGMGLAIAALVVAIAAAAGAGYMWQELQKTRGSIEAMQSASNQRLSELQSARDQLAARVESQQGDVQQLRNSLQSAKGERDALAQAMRQMRTRLSQDRSEWTLAEAEYLLTIANRSLRLERNVPTAMAALQAADQRLAQQADPALIPVREAIAKELQRLRAVPKVDISGTAAKIGGLMAQVDQLPLPGQARLGPAEPGGGTGQAPQPVSWRDWRAWLSAVWQQLRGLVTIRHSGQVGRPLMSPEQQYFLRQNLLLKLETARAALLEGQPTVYRNALEDAHQWAGEYFVADAPATQAFEQTLSDLAQVELKPPLPDISASLRTLRKTMDQLGRRSASPSGEGAQ